MLDKPPNATVTQMAFKLLYLARRAPTVAWEDWPRTWKSHAVFASQFPAMSGTFNWLRYTTRVDGPVVAGLPVSTGHDGVSVAEAPELATLTGKDFSPPQRALIDRDELRVFDRYTPEFSFYCREARVPDGPLGDAAIFHFLPRSARVPRETFDEYLQGQYVDKCAESAKALGARRWGLNLTIEIPPPDFPFEAIEECWFATIDDAARAVSAPAMRDLADSLATVCDLERRITMLTRTTHRYPKEPKL
jgi:hypothetical protein